jgi:GTP cyclohydrolase I
MEANHYCEINGAGVKDMDDDQLGLMRGVFLKDSTLRRGVIALIQKG